MSNYVRILLKEFYSAIKNEIMECHKATEMDDGLIDKMLQNATENKDDYED